MLSYAILDNLGQEYSSKQPEVLNIHKDFEVLSYIILCFELCWQDFICKSILRGPIPGPF